MRRTELEHIIRAAAAITDQYEIVVIGSQSILGSYPDAPDLLLQSMEADVCIATPDASTIKESALSPPAARRCK